MKKIISDKHTESSRRFIQAALYDLNQVEIRKIIKILESDGVLKYVRNKYLFAESLPGNKFGWNTAKKLGKDAEHKFGEKLTHYLEVV